MASIAGDLTKEIVPLALIGVGAIILIKNPAIVGGFINWIDQLTKGLGGGGGTGQQPGPTSNSVYIEKTTTPGQAAGTQMWNTFSLMPGGDPFKALLAAAFGTTAVNMFGGGSPSPQGGGNGSQANSPSFKDTTGTPFKPNLNYVPPGNWSTSQAQAYVQQRAKYVQGAGVLTSAEYDKRLKNYLAR